jgi:hypothetical protein
MPTETPNQPQVTDTEKISIAKANLTYHLPQLKLPLNEHFILSANLEVLVNKAEEALTLKAQLDEALNTIETLTNTNPE